MVAPPANAIGQQGLIQAVSIMTGDTAKMLAAQKKMLATQGEIMKLTGTGDMIKTTSTPGAKTVDGVKLDQFTTTMKMDPQTPQEQQAAFMMQMLYGPKGITGYTGEVATDKMIAVMGGDDALLSSSIASSKANSDALGKGVAAKVSAALPQNRLGDFYLPVDTIATTVLDVMAARDAGWREASAESAAVRCGGCDRRFGDPHRRIRSGADGAEPDRRGHADVAAEHGRRRGGAAWWSVVNSVGE